MTREIGGFIITFFVRVFQILFTPLVIVLVGGAWITLWFPTILLEYLCRGKTGSRTYCDCGEYWANGWCFTFFSWYFQLIDSDVGEDIIDWVKDELIPFLNRKDEDK